MNKDDDLNLEKGLGKILSTAALAGTMAISQGGMNSSTQSLSPRAPKPSFSATELVPEKQFDHKSLQDAMARVESNGGKNTNHDMLTAGPDAGTRAKGHYGLTNSTIKDIIKNNSSLKASHGHVLNYDDDQMHNLIYNEQPYLQHHLASNQIDNITRALGTNKPEHVAYAWLNGITGAKKAINEGKDIKGHWHVQKVLEAYNDIMNNQAKKSHFDLIELLQKQEEKTPVGLHAKLSEIKSKEVSLEIQKLLSVQWKEARQQLAAEDKSESTKPSPLKQWNQDLEDLKNNETRLAITALIKSQLKKI